MSYDVWLEVDVGGDDHLELDILHENYTWNVGPMFYAALKDSVFESEDVLVVDTSTAEEMEERIDEGPLKGFKILIPTPDSER